MIGGGDWAKDRVVADTMRAWSKRQSVKIRCPDATRPWQHVLEPLSGYLSLGSDLFKSPRLNHEAFNFGPSTPSTQNVLDLLENMHGHWIDGGFEEFTPYEITEKLPFREAELLKLNCDKAKFLLDWSSALDYQQTVSYVVDWYKHYYVNESDMSPVTDKQIQNFENILKDNK